MRWICEATWDGMHSVCCGHPIWEETLYCHTHPYTQWAAVTSQALLTREAPQSSLPLYERAVSQGQAPSLALFPPTIFGPTSWATIFSPHAIKNNGRKSIYCILMDFLWSWKLSGSLQTNFRWHTNCIQNFKWRLGGKHDNIFTYVYGYTVTESVSPVNTVYCNRRIIIFQKLCILKHNIV